MAMGDGEVILFPKSRDDTVVPDAKIKRKEWSECQHKVQLVLDQQAHQLICPACDQVLDPFDWITEYIRNWEYDNMRFKQAKQQALDMERRVDELKKAETNTKARIRKGGLVITSKAARAAYEQLKALSYIYSDRLRESGLKREQEREKLQRMMTRFGYKPDEIKLALKELSAICNLEVPDDLIEVIPEGRPAA